MIPALRIATRHSPLALWQAGHVRTLLEAAHPGLAITLVPLTTTGDNWQGGPLSAVGGKGLFVKELEEAMLDGRADLAVHSMKDVPAQQPAGLHVATFLPREEPADAFVSVRHARLDGLPQGATVGTSSLRRQAQLSAQRRDLRIVALRGNVGTRLRKLDDGEFDAILLACAGLRRLGLAHRIRQTLDVSRFVPAIGQGVIGIECREDDAATRALLAPLDDAHTATCIAAERALNAKLGGSCQVPVAGHAVLRGGTLLLTGLVAAPDGSRIVRDEIEGPAADAATLGATLGDGLLAHGARDILAALGAKA